MALDNDSKENILKVDKITFDSALLSISNDFQFANKNQQIEIELGHLALELEDLAKENTASTTTTTKTKGGGGEIEWHRLDDKFSLSKRTIQLTKLQSNFKYHVRVVVSNQHNFSTSFWTLGQFESLFFLLLFNFFTVKIVQMRKKSRRKCPRGLDSRAITVWVVASAVVIMAT